MKKRSLILHGITALAIGWGSAAYSDEQQNIRMETPKKGLDNILFISNQDGDHEIYLIKKLGEKPIQLTNNNRDDVGINWSPDGRKILFSSMQDGNSEIYLMDADGGNQINLTRHKGLDISPSWSPDGQKILFVSNRGGKEDVYILNLKNQQLSKITQSTSGAFMPQWSPDGKKLAYTLRNEGNKSVHLVLADADGNNPIKLTNHKKNIDMQFDWAPDSRSIILASKRKKHINIFKIDTTTRETVQLTDTTFADVMPSYSPDGKKILFLSQREDGIRQELYVMNSDGSKPQKLIDSKNMEYMNPGWSPNGKWITFSRYENRHFMAYSYSLDREKLVRLSSDNGFQFHPTYAPANSQALLLNSVYSDSAPNI